VNNYARFSCIAGDWDTLKTLLPQIDPPMLAAWDEPTYDDCVRAVRPRINRWVVVAGAVALLMLVSLWAVVRRRSA